MIKNINSMDDVSLFVKQIINEGINFHPDDDFHDVVNYETGKPFYSSEGAERRNRLVDKCFEYCEANDKDFYTIALEIFKKEIGLDKYITDEK